MATLQLLEKTRQLHDAQKATVLPPPPAKPSLATPATTTPAAELPVIPATLTAPPSATAAAMAPPVGNADMDALRGELAGSAPAADAPTPPAATPSAPTAPAAPAPAPAPAVATDPLTGLAETTIAVGDAAYQFDGQPEAATEAATEQLAGWLQRLQLAVGDQVPEVLTNTLVFLKKHPQFAPMFDADTVQLFVRAMRTMHGKVIAKAATNTRSRGKRAQLVEEVMADTADFSLVLK